MALAMVVSDLISQVRDDLDEFNSDQITDESIVNKLNRAQRAAMNTASRKYPEAFLTDEVINLVSGTSEYDLPEAFGGRVQHIELLISGVPYEIKRVSFRELKQYQTTSSATPMVWAVVGKQYHIAPTPNADYEVRLWYLKKLEDLVKDQGRVTRISGNTLYVDEVGEDLSVTSETLSNYVNLVDRETGLVKATMQVQNLGSGVITLKSTPDRSTVLNRTVTGTVPATLNVDDYICIVSGTCVSEFDAAYIDFIVKHAVIGLKIRMGDDVQGDYAELSKLTEELEAMWLGRESALRVKRSNARWILRR
jgi:hypothetical protein